MTKRLLILSVLVVLYALPALSLSGVTVDPSQSIYSARQLGLGGVSLGFNLDANSVFTNPPDLVDSQFPQLSASSRNVMLNESTYLLSALAIPTDYGLFGIGYVGLSTGGSLPTIRDPSTGRIIVDPTSEASNYSNTALVLAYARTILPTLNIGGNLKFFNQAITGTGGDHGAGWGIDLGATYQCSNWLKLSANAQNIFSSPIKWTGAEDKLGGYYKLGGKINFWGISNEAFIPSSQKVDIGLELDLPNNILSANNGMLLHAGVEYAPLKNIFLRGGINQEVAGTGLTLGIGFINSGFRFDYAYLQRPGLPGDNPHYFSLSYIGERTVTAKRKIKSITPHVKVLQPHDRIIIDAESIVFSAEAQVSTLYSQTTVWDVSAISKTQEVKDVMEVTPLSTLYFNGKLLEQTATIEFSQPLTSGRNALQISGSYITYEAMTKKATPEVFACAATDEVKILRFSPFKDAPMDYWAIEPIALTITLGLVKGYPDNTFKPDKGISRAELVTLLVRTLPIKLEELPSGSKFNDISSNHWAEKYINYGTEKGLVTGYPDGTFKPNKVLNRAEGITIITRYAGIKEDLNPTAAFTDLKDNFWANKYISPAKANGLLKYLEGEEFKPSATFTRAEACDVIYRTSVIKEKVDRWWNTGSI